MSKYNNTKFYWLQLKEDFFEDDAIQWLEEQEPNGKDYAYFYLKLCLKSLKTNGVLIRKVGNILIPYDNKKLAELTKTDFDTVTIAMELLKKIGLVSILENGELYLNQLEEFIGSQSVGAFKKQQQILARKLRGGKNSAFCPPKIDIELELEQELDIETEEEKKIKKEKYNIEFEELWKLYPNKQGRTKALSSYIKARDNGTTFEEIKKGLDNYLNFIKIDKIQTHYVKHGSTWFNQECWKDEYKTTNLDPNNIDWESLGYIDYDKRKL